MKSKPSMVALRSLLFVFDIENTKCENREKIIVSKDINNDQELAELFDILLKTDFLTYTPKERKLFIDTISHHLSTEESFDDIFTKMDTYFDTDIEDQRHFMKVLLERLRHYHSKSIIV